MSNLCWQPLGQMWNEFDRAHEMNRFLRYIDQPDPEGSAGVLVAYPPVNVSVDDENIYLEAELPGITPEGLEITMTDGNRLTLKGQRKPAEAGETTWHRLEHSFGSFSRTLTLPVLVDADRVEVHFALGVLRVKLPKCPQAQPRRIEVQQN